MKLIAMIALLSLAAFGTASAQAPDAPPPPPLQAEDAPPPPPPPPPPPQTAQVRRFIETMNALANGVACVQGTVKQIENVAAPQHGPDPVRVDRPRSPRNTMVLVSVGAASGAAIGAAITKDGRGPMYGAVAGGIAGLIYDLVSNKQPTTY
jgi:hypothetical protein